MTDEDRAADRMTESTIDETRHEVEADPPPDEAVDRFLALESELAATEAATRPKDTPRPSGIVVDAGTVPNESVPKSYPVKIRTTEALELRLALRSGERTAVYLEWPGTDGIDSESVLGRLLAALDMSAGEFANLYGTTVLLEREERHYTVFVPSEPPRGTGAWELGVAGGLAFNLLVLGLFAVWTAGISLGGVLSALLLPFLGVNLLVLPWATYRDATYLRTHSDWNQGPLFWGVLSMVPGVNIAVSIGYLWSRSRARFLGSEPSLWGKFIRKVRDLS